MLSTADGLPFACPPPPIPPPPPGPSQVVTVSPSVVSGVSNTGRIAAKLEGDLAAYQQAPQVGGDGRWGWLIGLAMWVGWWEWLGGGVVRQR